MRNNKVVTGAGKPANKTPKDMKIKVTFQSKYNRRSNITIDVSQDSISNMLKEFVYNELSDKVSANISAGRARLIKYGYVVKIEDLDLL